MDTTKYQTGIYAIIDKVAGQIIGGLQAHKHEAAAVRFYSDVAAMKESLVGKHPQDFDLYRLGHVNLDHEIEPEKTIILRGSMWAVAQEEVNQELKLERA